MLDKVVSLAVYEVKPDAEAAAAPDVEVEVQLRPDIRHPQIRLRLWDKDGRNPQVPQQVSLQPARWKLENVHPGSTLTWLVRLVSTEHSHFELRLQVFQAGAALPDGNFSYSGPLEGLEERSGRFHFTTARPSG